MNIIFVGGFFPKHIEKDIRQKSKHQVQNSANNFQWAIIKGIEKNIRKSIILITAPFIGYFPLYYSASYIPASNFSHNNDTTDFSIGFLNLPIIKNIVKYIKIKRKILEIIKDTTQNWIIILYSLDLAYLKAVVELRRKNINVRICVIITDLPEFQIEANIFSQFYKKHFEYNSVYNSLKYFDCFVVLTNGMLSKLKIGDKPNVIVEGLFDNIEEDSQKSQSDGDEIVILYTGTLSEMYGLKNLLDAFAMIHNKNYRLWICGGGEVGAKLIQNRIQNDDRIVFWGLINRARILELQKRATILINPRNNYGEYNKYSFPSKTMEYFASGTPVLIYKLDGIPEEYYDYCYTVDDNSPLGLANAITKICNLDKQELTQKGESARDFILNRKNSIVQCEKIVRLLNQVNNNFSSGNV